MRELEAEVWCKGCQHYYGKVYRVLLREGIYEHQTDPTNLPKMCSLCEMPLERRPA